MRTVLARNSPRAASWPAALAMLTLAPACSPPDHVTVDHAWVRLSAVRTNPAAAYFTIHGGPNDETLINVTADTAVRAEMHETMKMDRKPGQRMMTMQPVKTLPLPARAVPYVESP